MHAFRQAQAQAQAGAGVCARVFYNRARVYVCARVLTTRIRAMFLLRVRVCECMCACVLLNTRALSRGARYAFLVRGFTPHYVKLRSLSLLLTSWLVWQKKSLGLLC